MKKFFYSLFAITMAVFSFTSCEDVPEPYNIPEKPGTGGDGGEEELQGSGSGTLLDPYDCIAAINYCKLLGENVESAENVYVKGIVSKIKEVDTGSYGNASFYISNDGSTNNEFYVYHAYYLGNKKYTSADQIKEGDEVIIYGKVVNYVSNYGSTPETSGGKAYIYSLNGVTEDAGGDEPNVPGEGEYINESFGSSFGSFTVKTVKGTAWIIDYSSAKATGYDNSSKISTPSDSYIVSNAIDLSKSTGAYITFSYILRYFTNNGDAKPGVKDEVLITDNYTGDPSTTKWTDISGKLTEGSDWSTWYTYSMDIPAEFISKSNVVIALHYTCEDNSATWEVKNLVVKEGKAEQGGTDEPGGGDEPGGEVSGNSLSVTFADFGWENQTAMEVVTLTDGTTLAFDAGGNSNGPKYYTTGNAVRMYPKNSVVINSSKKIVSIKITCDNYNGTLYNASGDISADTGSVSISGDDLLVSAINSSKVTLTNVSTTTGAPSQLRAKSIVITYEE